MVEGIRERKKQQTRELIASCAASLFAEQGYEQVSVRQVAAAADVSEQTVYNHFLTKEHLVLDRDTEFRQRLAQAIRDRPPGSGPAEPLREIAVETLGRIEALDIGRARGGLAYLVAVSPGIRRICLEMTDQHADAMAEALLATDPRLDALSAKFHAVALAWAFQTIIDGFGAALVAGRTPAEAVAVLRPVIARIFDDLAGRDRPPTSPQS